MEKIIRFPGGTAKVDVRNKREKIQSYWAQNAFYEAQRNSLLSYIGNSGYKGGVWVDIGANIGNHALFFASVCKAQKVYAYEPDLSLFDHLKKNIELNLEYSILARRCAISDYNGDGSLIYPDIPIEQGGAGAARLTNEGKQVSVFTLDSMNIEPDYIKIDVEGGELVVLKGAEKTLKKYHPEIFVEITANEKEIREYLKSLNYQQKGSRLNHTPTYHFA